MDSDAGYLSELLAEKDSLDPSFVNCMRLLTREINRIQSGETAVSSNVIKGEEEENGSQANEAMEGDDQQEGAHNDTHIQQPRRHRDHIPRRHFPVEENKLYKPVKLLEKVYIPAKEHPKFNFVGKLLGPRGNTFKRLQNSTGTKMSILGRGSMRDKEKEEDLKSKGEPKYEHLNDDLHVLIEVEAPPGQAHARLGIAIEELKKYLVPDTNDEIRQEQMREMAILNSLEDNGTSSSPPPTSTEQPTTQTFTRGRGRARPLPTVGRGVHITRQGHPVAIRRVQQGHQISLAARTAAGLSSHVPARAQAPGAIDPFGGVHTVLVPNEIHKTEHVQLHDTYDPAYAFEAAYAEPDEGAFFEYGRGVTPEIYETAYPAPGRLPTSMAANYKTSSHRPAKKIIREATYPY